MGETQTPHFHDVWIFGRVQKYGHGSRVVFSPIRLAFKGFLLYSKAMGGLYRGEFDPGSLKDAAPRLPWASRAWFLAPKSKDKNVKNVEKCIRIV